MTGAFFSRYLLELTTEERNEVKKFAREQLVKLKDLLVLNWRHKIEARSQLKLAIEDTDVPSCLHP